MQLLTQCSYRGTFTQFLKMFLSDMSMYVVSKWLPNFIYMYHISYLPFYLYTHLMWLSFDFIPMHTIVVSLIYFHIFVYICLVFFTAMYSPFFDHVLGYWNARNRPAILFVSYEDLHQNPVKVIKEIAEFLEVSSVFILLQCWYTECRAFKRQILYLLFAVSIIKQSVVLQT